MDSFIVTGGKRLKGEITPQGAKNEALQVICAALLTPEKVTINNIPEIADVGKLIDLLEKMGVEITKESVSTISFKAEKIDFSYLQTKEFQQQHDLPNSYNLQLCFILALCNITCPSVTILTVAKAL